MSAVRITGVGHTGITVSDLNRSVAFYRDVLGFEVSEKVRCTGEIFEKVTGVPDADLDVVFVQAPGHVIELLSYRKPEHRAKSSWRACDAGSWHIAFKVKDIDIVVEAVRNGGFLPVNPVQTVPEGPARGGACARFTSAIRTALSWN